MTVSAEPRPTADNPQRRWVVRPPPDSPGQDTGQLIRPVYFHFNILRPDQNPSNTGEWNALIVYEPFGFRHYEMAAIGIVGPLFRPATQPPLALQVQNDVAGSLRQRAEPLGRKRCLVGDPKTTQDGVNEITVVHPRKDDGENDRDYDRPREFDAVCPLPDCTEAVARYQQTVFDACHTGLDYNRQDERLDNTLEWDRPQCRREAVKELRGNEAGQQEGQDIQNRFARYVHCGEPGVIVAG